MKTLPFKVSAKTARLIGRENVSKAEGALAELVKNTYDADANICVVAFVLRYSVLPEIISESEYQYLKRELPETKDNFQTHERGYQLQDFASEDFKNYLLSVMDLWIIDDGVGMTEDVIENEWMVIGTNYKEINIKSSKGRVRTGAKGIGRFSLDRLGSMCELYSMSNQNGIENSAFKWEVNWDNFDGRCKVLEEVTASLETISTNVEQIIKTLDIPESALNLLKGTKKSGTAIRISFLRDNWIEKNLVLLENSLSNLVLPKEQRKFSIYVVDARRDQKIAEIDSSVLDDFYYQLIANVQKNGEIKIQLYRNECDASKFPNELFELEDMKNIEYQESSFANSPLEIKKHISELLPYYFKSVNENENENLVGPFKLILSFYKRTSSSEAQKFYYRDFDYSPRKKWLSESGGIKIYRDGFAVRPYGDAGGNAFDWLGLGARKARNHVKSSGKGWRVGPDNIAGTVQISRDNNSLLIDQSNREGIIQNEAYEQFKDIIIELIKVFEDDRSHILFNLDAIYKQNNSSARANEKSPNLVRKVLLKKNELTHVETQELARGYEYQKQELEDSLNVQVILRNLATLGGILVSFAHEMGEFKNSFGRRQNDMHHSLDYLIKKGVVDEDKLKKISPIFDPYAILESWDKTDKAAQGWFDFVLKSVSGSRTNRKNINILKQLNEIQIMWAPILSAYSIILYLNFSEKSEKLVNGHSFHILSIFNNLINNSVEAILDDKRSNPDAQISISIASENDFEICINYQDNGPGLSSRYLNEPFKILNFGETTKNTKLFTPSESGLGMWILASTVKELGGKIEIEKPQPSHGFECNIYLTKMEGYDTLKLIA